jgi:hypothetical protein
MRSSLSYFLPLSGKRRHRLAGGVVALDRDIVDEPRVAEPCRGEKPDRSLAARGDWGKGFGMTGFEIIRDETRRRDSFPGGIESGLNRNSPFDVAGAPAKRRIKAGRKHAFFCR